MSHFGLIKAVVMDAVINRAEDDAFLLWHKSQVRKWHF